MDKQFTADLTVAALEGIGKFELRCANTINWPLGSYKTDIMRRVATESGYNNIPTDTFTFNVIEEVTPPYE